MSKNNYEIRSNNKYFSIIKTNKKTSNNYYSLEQILNNINIEEYNILKSTANQKEITYNELLKEEYSGYILFKKDINLEHIMIWCNNYYIPYLSKLTPPFNPHNKVIIRS